MDDQLPLARLVEYLLGPSGGDPFQDEINGKCEEPVVKDALRDLQNAQLEGSLYEPLKILINHFIDFANTVPIDDLERGLGKVSYLRLEHHAPEGSSQDRKPDGVIIEEAVLVDRREELRNAEAELRKAEVALQEAKEKPQNAKRTGSPMSQVPTRKSTRTTVQDAARSKKNEGEGEEESEDEHEGEEKDKDWSDPERAKGLKGKLLYPFRKAVSDAMDGVKLSKKNILKPHWSQIIVSFEIKPPGTKSPPAENRSLSLPVSHSTSTSTSTGSSKGKRSLASTNTTLSSTSEPKKRKTTADSNATPKLPNPGFTPDVVTDPDVQLLGYIAEMRSALGNRTHSFGCSVKGTRFTISCFDACGKMRSQGIDIIKDTVEFAWIIIGLARATREKLGFDRHFIKPTATRLPTDLKGWHFEFPATFLQAKFLPDKNPPPAIITGLLHSQWCAAGRGTVVFSATWTGDEEPRSCALKISYPYAGRVAEDVLIADAKEVVPDNIVTVYGHADGCLVSEGARAQLVQGGTLGNADRRPKVILMELLTPLHNLPICKSMDFRIQIVEALVKLAGAQIYHRDISSGNLMARTTDPIAGVIGDWDHGIKFSRPPRPEYDVTGTHRTGTYPFLAMSLLWCGEKGPFPRHILRFDLESTVYALIWDAFYHATGELCRDPREDLDKYFKSWFLDTAAEMKMSLTVKLAVIEEAEDESLDKLKRSAPRLWILIDNLCSAQGKMAAKLVSRRKMDVKERWAFEGWEDLDGAVTGDTVLVCFKGVREVWNSVL